MLLIAGEARTAREGTIAVPLVRLESAERETGGVAVDVIGAGEIKDRLARGLDAADPADLGETVAGRESPSMAAFRYRPQEGRAPRSLSVAVARYTPEAVVVANVEEARYEILASNEGKTLVRARYAVRNNQRSFLALRLPDDAVLWSASAGGRPVRPGRALDGGLLMPLLKGRVGEDAPPSLVEVVYIQTGAAWQRDGRARLMFPAIDLQISRTALSLYHSPQYEVKPEPGAFRLDEYSEPASEAFAESTSQTTAEADRAGGNRPEVVQQQAPEQLKAEAEVQSLVTQYQRQNASARVAGILPVQVPFVEFGTWEFFVSELTAEATAPVLDLHYKQTRKGE